MEFSSCDSNDDDRHNGVDFVGISKMFAMKDDFSLEQNLVSPLFVHVIHSCIKPPCKSVWVAWGVNSIHRWANIGRNDTKKVELGPFDGT